MTVPDEFTFFSNELQARDGITRVISALAEVGIGQDHLGSVEIALAETINNIVEHAYAGMPPGEVRVQFVLEPQFLTLTVRDKGNALPNEQMPQGPPADLDVARIDLPEGGFGWFLIRELTSALIYVRTDGTNVLTLQFDLDRDGI